MDVAWGAGRTSGRPARVAGHCSGHLAVGVGAATRPRRGCQTMGPVKGARGGRRVQSMATVHIRRVAWRTGVHGRGAGRWQWTTDHTVHHLMLTPAQPRLRVRTSLARDQVVAHARAVLWQARAGAGLPYTTPPLTVTHTRGRSTHFLLPRRAAPRGRYARYVRQPDKSRGGGGARRCRGTTLRGHPYPSASSLEGAGAGAGGCLPDQPRSASPAPGTRRRQVAARGVRRRGGTGARWGGRGTSPPVRSGEEAATCLPRRVTARGTPVAVVLSDRRRGGSPWCTRGGLAKEYKEREGGRPRTEGRPRLDS